ncbi:MAG: beta-galactosidase [Armatimonadota bacterium]|nr:beta-galactosidase [Armatimonadota bacterium]
MRKRQLKSMMKLLYSFEDEGEVQAVIANHTRLKVVSRGATHGKRALHVEFLPNVDWPNLMFRTSTPWDWRGYGALVFDLYNPSDEPIRFGVRVDDDPRADGTNFCRQGTQTIAPRQRASFALRLGRAPMDYGMRGLPPLGKNIIQVGITNRGAIRLEHIVAFQIFLWRSEKPRVLIVDNIRLIPVDETLRGIVDEFGQYAHADWRGKIKSISHLRRTLRYEMRDLARHPAPADFDEYGAWKSGPQLKATGYFRTEKVNGKWWLVAPNGRLFFSTGMDCVHYGDPTFITGREQMFTWLPREGEPLAKHYARHSGVHSGPIKEGITYNFYAANLERKYGENYPERWREHTIRRLRSWGFNTIANWSLWEWHRNGRIPYVATVGIWGEHKRVPSGSDYWGKMHDPYDPQFAQNARASIEPVAQRVKGDPWCLGFFVDNELSWAGQGEENGRYGLAYGALSLHADESPAKRAFLEQLRAKYGDIQRLNAAWNANYPSWDALRPPVQLPSVPTRERQRDFSEFVRAFARKYFQTVRDLLRELTPNHLYLGCRFAWYSLDAVAACAELCDVISFNIYAPKLDHSAYAFLMPFDKPVIIGEFHFGALDRGMFHTGLVAAANQRERARMYEEYVQSVLDHPLFVGCHWFQYMDQPLTGRWFDGENYNIGFVSITDTPYPEMVAAARRVHSGMYARRWRS